MIGAAGCTAGDGVAPQEQEATEAVSLPLTAEHEGLMKQALRSADLREVFESLQAQGWAPVPTREVRVVRFADGPTVLAFRFEREEAEMDVFHRADTDTSIGSSELSAVEETEEAK
ncbi:hypothetical protein EON82_20435 [bacterium]|nr:MAG: hypothetical protein EON82_20435 [bacterium]